MPQPAIAVLTTHSRERMIASGGSASWVLNRAHARDYAYVVCMRNGNHPDAEGSEAHGTAFLMARISEIVRSPEDPKRWKIAFSDYAELDQPKAWQGWRNPVRYTTLDELGIELHALKFKPMPEKTGRQEGVPLFEPTESSRPLTLVEAKNGLAKTFNVSPDAIEITIKA